MQIQEPTITDLSLMNHTHATTAQGGSLGAVHATSVNGLSFTTQSVGFTIAGGVTSKTLTVPLDASVSGTNTGDQTNITGNAGTITLANDAASATDYLTFANGATGSQAIKTNAGVTVNPNTATITATTFSGALSGNATTATTATNATNVTTTTKADNVNYFLPFVAANSSSNQAVDVGPMTANPSTSTITATNFAGNASTATSATSATTATNANNVNLANDTASATDYLVFTNTATGNQPLKTNTGVSVNPSTATITATTFSGALSGNATTATNASGLTGNPSISVTDITMVTAGHQKLTVPTGDTTATGIITDEFNSGYSSTAIGDLVYLDSSATWQKCDNTTSATTYGSGPIGIALEVKASGNACKVLLQGFVYAASAFPTFTVGAPVYMSTAAAVVVAQPSAANAAIRVVGYGINADKMYFNPSNDYIVHV